MTTKKEIELLKIELEELTKAFWKSEALLQESVNLLKEIRPTIPKEILSLWCEDRNKFLDKV